MSDVPIEAASFDNSRILSRVTDAIGSNLATYFGLSLILAGIPNFLFGWWQFGTRIDVARIGAEAIYFVPGYWLQFLALIGVTMICDAILQTTLTHATTSQLAGKTPDFVLSLETGLRLAAPVIVIALIVSLSSMAAMLLLIVPGVLLWLRWSMAIPAYVQERIGILESLKRSADLTRNHRGDIFMIMLILVIGMAVLNWIVTRFIGPIFGSTTSQPVYALFQGLYASFNSAVSLTVIASIYIELRNVKDGVLPRELAEIFA